MEALMKAMGYTFKNEAYLKTALTHPSMGGEDNQRLEFLGDAVLQFLMSDQLYHKNPMMREGGLTHQRALLVCEAALSQVARGIDLGSYLRMDKGEASTRGREKPSILADAMEAVLAAVYLDGGIDAAREMMLRLWPRADEIKNESQDGKSALQEYLQSKGMATPVYETIDQQGPPHDRTFTAQVLVDGKPVAKGQGKSKKAAEQQAAQRALEMLKRP